MAKEGSVAPQERVNIVYKPATGDAKEQVELPLKLLLMGDYTLQTDERPLEDREPIDINKDNFNQVMREQNLQLSFSVPNRLSESEGEELPVNLKVETLKDFDPGSIAEQVPELQKLMELRNALLAVKGPLGNIPAFKKKIEQIMGDAEKRNQLLKDLGVGEHKSESSETPG